MIQILIFKYLIDGLTQILDRYASEIGRISQILGHHWGFRFAIWHACFLSLTGMAIAGTAIWNYQDVFTANFAHPFVDCIVGDVPGTGVLSILALPAASRQQSSCLLSSQRGSERNQQMRNPRRKHESERDWRNRSLLHFLARR